MNKSWSKKIIWLTGNSGAGKTTLALLLQKKLQNTIVLDGDELRSSISTDLGFSETDRDAHNMRAARLAQILNNQGFSVIVSIIAPFKSTRDKITGLINPYWIYIKGGKIRKDMPYEIPTTTDLTIDPMKQNINESLEKILKLLN